MIKVRGNRQLKELLKEAEEALGEMLVVDYDMGMEDLARRLAQEEAAIKDRRSLSRRDRSPYSEREDLTRELKERYEAGESIRALAQSTGKSYGYVHRILTEAGVALRGSGKTQRATDDSRKRKTVG